MYKILENIEINQKNLCELWFINTIFWYNTSL